MKKSTQKKIITDISAFDETISLYNLLAGGSGKGIILLRKLVDQLHNDNYSNVISSKTPSVLIYGREGKSITAKAFLRALGVQNIRQIQACYIEGEGYLLALFNDSNADTGYIIHRIED